MRPSVGLQSQSQSQSQSQECFGSQVKGEMRRGSINRGIERQSRDVLKMGPRYFFCLLMVLILVSMSITYYSYLFLASRSLFNNGTSLLQHLIKATHILDLSSAKYPNSAPSQEPIGKSRTKRVLLWTSFFGKSDYIGSPESYGCQVNNCVFSSDRRLLAESDAVILHLRDIDLKDLPPSRSPSQRWILLHHESPAHTPDILRSLEGLINWTATYRRDSDIYLSPVFRPKQGQESNVTKNYGEGKTGFAAWLVSNCNTPSKREELVEELRKTVTVDIFGECGEKQCVPKMSRECHQKIGHEYRFYLSFENTICKDYVTEKFFDITNYDIIPVVLGGAEYSRIAPTGSFIDALAFSTPEKLGQYLLRVARHPHLYNAYFGWKNHFQLTLDHYSCQICRKLNDHLEPVKIWTNLYEWWFSEANCRGWLNSDKFLV